MPRRAPRPTRHRHWRLTLTGLPQWTKSDSGILDGRCRKGDLTGSAGAGGALGLPLSRPPRQVEGALLP
jgi:hypothetical protein